MMMIRIVVDCCFSLCYFCYCCIHHDCCQIYQLCLSIRYIYIYLLIYTVDVHVQSDRYAFISLSMHVHIVNIHWVGPRKIQTDWPFGAAGCGSGQVTQKAISNGAFMGCCQKYYVFLVLCQRYSVYRCKHKVYVCVLHTNVL